MENEEIIDFEPKSVEFKYAGFWIRVGAYLLDILILLIPTILLQSAITSSATFNTQLIEQLANTLMWVVYYGALESSSAQATLGKRAVGIKVVDLNGERLTFGRAAGRYLAMYISAILLLMGFIMVAFDKKKQGLHDKLANCLVVYS